MRTVTNLNGEWLFNKDTEDIDVKGGQRINLPHTWNAEDGQDGGNDYFRGSCVYTRTLRRGELPDAERYFLEVCGASAEAEVFIDGVSLAIHRGGYSKFRVDITEHIGEACRLAIRVTNGISDSVYPQTADFTFYGGLYRGVNIIGTASTHFELEHYGTPGIKVTAEPEGQDFSVDTEVYVKNPADGDMIEYRILDGDGRTVSREVSTESQVRMKIKNAHLWQGRRDPYLYTAEARILRDGQELDSVRARFGCRSFRVDPDKGFFLNGEEYPLRGVSRHQDRGGIGNALLPEHHREDMSLICEVGANTVRLAHYQHDEYFYDLCDEYGMVVWAEIPYISKHLEQGEENTLTQMRELITQCYNHPSICFWGLSNEITIGGAGDGILENHRLLNDLVKRLDRTRLTAVAAVSSCKTDEPYLKIPDLVAYNHYFGWYGGEVGMNGPWLDKFHREHPSTPIGLSEYGCEALDWHSSSPTQGDYTEEYQAYYHEEMIKQISDRKYLFATYLWNMFDFGADARAEGGENGQNHKGLVTIDRKYRKDAFYAYKAHWSKEPFIHIAGKRYTDRPDSIARITVYSNMPEVELYVNGVSVGRKRADDRFFRFEVQNEGRSRIEAKAGELSDSMLLCRVDKLPDKYILKEKNAVLNWFDVEVKEGHFSLNDKISDIAMTLRGRLWLGKMALAMKRRAPSEAGGGFSLSAEALEMMGGLTPLRLSGMLGMMGISFTKEELLRMNRQLLRIRKPRDKK